MITGGIEQARDEVFDLLAAIDFSGVSPVVRNWQAELIDQPVDTVVIWCSMQHTSQRQRGFADTVKRYESFGIITVAIRAPVATGGLTIGDNLATLVVQALRGVSTPNGIWFRNVTPRDETPKDGNVRMNVVG